MMKYRHASKLTLKPETVRILSDRETALAAGGSAGTSAPSNTVSGGDCGPGGTNSWQGTCYKTL